MKDKDNFISDLKETMKRQNEQIDKLREDLNNNQSYSLTVELGMLREENNELKKNIQIQKDDFQVRLKEQKERYEDDYNKLLERNLNFDFEQNQK